MTKSWTRILAEGRREMVYNAVDIRRHYLICLYSAYIDRDISEHSLSYKRIILFTINNK